jgi:hypothetical protein
MCADRGSTMTERKHARKDAVRERMSRTGETYTQANAFLARQLGRAAEAAAQNPAIEPTEDELNLLITEYRHLQSHRLGDGWKQVDGAAFATSRALLDELAAAYAGSPVTFVKVRVNPIDTAHACSEDSSKELLACAYAGPADFEFKMHRHPEDSEAAYGCEFTAGVDRLIVGLELYGGATSAHPLLEEDLAAPGAPVETRDYTWEVADQDIAVESRRVWQIAAEHEVKVLEGTAPTYLDPWMREEGWAVPDGGTWMDAEKRQG